MNLKVFSEFDTSFFLKEDKVRVSRNIKKTNMYTKNTIKKLRICTMRAVGLYVKKVVPSSRIRTSDLRIPTMRLQSSALPTELSMERL